MKFIRQGATHKVVIGPAVAVGDGFTPVTTLALSTADEAEVILHDNGTVVDISGYTFAAITTADGYYHLTLQSGISNTVGHVTVVINDDSLVLPLREDFTVLEEAVYDALFAASATGYQVPIWSGPTATVSLTNTTVATVTTTGTATNLTNLPTIPTNWITADGVANGAIDAATFAADVDAEARGWLGLASANLDTQLADLPNVAEFEARTLVSADYTVVSDLGTVQTGDSFARLTGTGAVTFASFTITGATTHTGHVLYSDGIAIASPSTANREGFIITGNGTGDGMKIIAGGGANSHAVEYQNASVGGDIIAYNGESDVTHINTDGNFTGGVGKVTGAINTATGTITTLDGLDTAQDTQHGTTQTYLSTNLGTNGVGATEAGGTGDQLTALATAAAQTTAQNDLDLLTGADGVTLATSQPNYAPAKVSDLGTVQTADHTAAIAAITADLPTRFTKNVAVSSFTWPMVDASDELTTGLTVTGSISKDGGTFSALGGTITEVGGGLYTIDTISGTEMNANQIVLKFSSTGAKDRMFLIATQPT